MNAHKYFKDFLKRLSSFSLVSGVSTLVLSILLLVVFVEVISPPPDELTLTINWPPGSILILGSEFKTEFKSRGDSALVCSS